MPTFPASRRIVAVSILALSLAPRLYGQASSSLKNEVAGVKAENAALREQVRNLEEQQKTMLLLLQEMKQRLDGVPSDNESSAIASLPLVAAAAPVRVLTPVTAAMTAALSVPALQSPQPPVSGQLQEPEPDSFMDRLGERYKDGFVIVTTDDDSKFPFQLKMNDTTQFRYTNTLHADATFTDHLGVVREVAPRNDFSINRSMISFVGYAFDKRLQYSLYLWASNTTATTVHGGVIGWQFNKGLTLQGGYWGVPGSRTLTYTFPYFLQNERSMADNFFRPGFSQGIFALGEPLKGFNYELFMGNGLNTLAIPTSKIDTHLTYSGSVWWEPFGKWGPTNRARNMYDDYYEHEKPVIRLGTSYTRSREDRFTNIDQSNPENTSIYNSDGVLAFATGAFAPGVTLTDATYRMWAIDAGLKYKGLALNGQYYFRWLNNFVADGPLPISSTYDHGFEFALSHFLVPRRVEWFARTSVVFGQFRNSNEWGGGIKFYPVRDHRVWLSGEGIRVNRSPVGGMITPYAGGLNGWAPTGQFMLTF